MKRLLKAIWSSIRGEILSIIHDPRSRTAAIWTLFFSFLAHGYRWFNACFNHDSLIIWQSDGLQQLYLGRWLVPFWLLVRGKIGVPLLIAVFSVCFLALADILLVRVLDIRKKYGIVLLCALLSASPSVTCLFSCFITATDIHTLAILLSVSAVWFFLSFRRGWIPACLALAGAMALYPSYAEVTVLLLILLIFKDIACSEKTVTEKGKIWRMFAFVAAGGFVYYAVWFIAVRYLSGAGLSASPVAGDYNSLNRLGDLRLSNLPDLVKGTYASFWQFVSFPETMHPRIVGLLNVLLAIGAFFLLVLSVRKPVRLLPAAALLLILPLGTNFAYIFSGGLVHSMMVFSFSILYAGALMCMEFPGRSEGLGKVAGTVTKVLMAIALSIIALTFIVFANQCHIRKNLEEQATLSVMTRILDRMEQTEGFEPGKTRVVFVGDLNESSVAQVRNGYDETNPVQWKCGYYSMTYNEGYAFYLQNVLGYPVGLVDHQTLDSYSQMPEVMEMPAFPATGCVKMIGDTLVVKLSEE